MMSPHPLRALALAHERDHRVRLARTRYGRVATIRRSPRSLDVA